MQLRLRGYTYRAIAAQLGISEASSHRLVTNVMERTVKRANESADQLRILQRERLEKLLAGIFREAVEGKLGAVDRAVKVLAELSKLDGLYVERPDVWKMDVDVSQLSQDQIRRLAAGEHPAQVLASAPDDGSGSETTPDPPN